MATNDTALPQQSVKTPEGTFEPPQSRLRSIEDLNQKTLKDFDSFAAEEGSGTHRTWDYRPAISRRREAEIEIDELYSSPEFTSKELQTAMRLLAEAVQYARAGREALRNGDKLGADETVLGIQSLLPELFACRGLGDGYGALINSIQLALINRRGMPLTESQLSALTEILTVTRDSPAIRFTKARQYIREFERHDFVVEPESLQFLDHFFDEP